MATIDRFRSALSAAATLDEASFGDERQRRVWMEAYVIAYEVALFSASGLAVAMVWAGDRTVGMWSIGVVWIVGLGNIAALSHLRANGLADLPWRARWSFWSFRLRMVLLVLWAIGLALTMFGDGGSFAERGGWSYVAGAICGAGVAIAGFALADRAMKRRLDRDLPEDDTFEDR
ncbi:hypothetical protein [Mobilicoccus sp.]|uniref:hypothetical protein n=1 Tax=Mobilicoccus sp. TaxID=2034349 RepID=UPI0028B0AE10|nr:hypothetical protein [Mobilicoccus sp.]